MGAAYQGGAGSCRRGGHQGRTESAVDRPDRQRRCGQRRAVRFDGGVRRRRVALDVQVLEQVREIGVTISRPQAADCRPCKVKC